MHDEDVHTLQEELLWEQTYLLCAVIIFIYWTAAEDLSQESTHEGQAQYRGNVPETLDFLKSPSLLISGSGGLGFRLPSSTCGEAYRDFSAQFSKLV